MRGLFVVVLLAFGSSAGAALAYSKFSHPKGDFALEFPSAWQQTPGLRALMLRPAGTNSGVGVILEGYPLGKNSAQTPKAYLEPVLEGVGRIKELREQKKATVAGRLAERVHVVWTAKRTGQYGETLPGPKHEIHVVIPVKKGFYVLRMEGVGASFEATLPEFERIVSTLKLGGR